MPLSIPTPALPFPLYFLPSIPFRRRHSSTSTSTTSPSHSPPMNPTSYLSPPSTAHLRCHKCLIDLAPTTSIISKGFNGRHGRAFLVAPPNLVMPRMSGVNAGDLPNTHTHKPVSRQLVTGAHTVSDISCVQCGSVLGWKYVAAEEESQRYKVGKYILEAKRVVRSVSWEGEAETEDDAYASMGGQVRKGDVGSVGDGEKEIEFDSQDEDECEDLFAGVWSPALARKRRRDKGFGTR